MFEKTALDVSKYSSFSTHNTQVGEKSVEEQGDMHRNFSASRASATHLK
jgi:hypothetical protein